MGYDHGSGNRPVELPTHENPQEHLGKRQASQNPDPATYPEHPNRHRALVDPAPFSRGAKDGSPAAAARRGEKPVPLPVPTAGKMELELARDDRQDRQTDAERLAPARDTPALRRWVCRW
ncbi:hypothetical protein CGLO_13338 [Colletotrichum gloeosporioides Cg-14]|uniref:Uncharacterized protein n=1 Tax=Colletotrichum gloeosporioides (strain Cg-14) TaxID=1237896 RepID=T0LH55_COLGC|nr:hypothetical protein CGLO_13338 [Colletotrichum gloeosporioides Cg-14]